MSSETYSSHPRSKRSWARFIQKDVAGLYGLFAVLIVASVQLFFSLQKGGFFVEQWYWGVAAVSVALVGAALVPGYFSSPSVGRKQWALAGALILLMVVVAASILWSISPDLSILEASRTAMYVGTFVLLLPAVARWGSLVVDATIFGALLPPALYGLLQKVFPTLVEYTGFRTLEADPRVSSTIGYHVSFGMMCAMGALLVVARVGSFRPVPLRALYSATGVLFLVALYFSFSRGALLAFAAGAVVLLCLTGRRLEVLGNLAITSLPALWVVSQAWDYPGLVTRPVSFEVMETDGLALLGLLVQGFLIAFVAQALFTLLVRAVERFVPGNIRRNASLACAVITLGVIIGASSLTWAEYQQAGGFDELRSRITTTDSELETEALATDTTQRFSSLSAANRMELWKIAWDNWRAHPFTGTGGDTYQFAYLKNAPEGSQDDLVLHPHSIWMSLLSDTGIFAFLAFAAFCVGYLALACYNAFSAADLRHRALIAGSAAAVTAYLVSSSVDWSWYIPASTLPFFALAAVTAGTVRRNSESD